MILVVFGHILMSMGLGGYKSVLSSILLTFRMPMFFFISGFIAFKPVEKWTLNLYRSTLKKKIVVQILPALFFFILFSICFNNNPLSAFRNGWGGYWFTFVLLEMFICYFTLSISARLIKFGASKIVDLGMITLSLLGILAIMFLRQHVGSSSWWQFLCLENTCKYMQFFTLGLFCRKYNRVFTGLIENDRFRATTILLFIIGLLLYFSNRLKGVSMLVFTLNHDIIVRYAGLLTVFIFFYAKRDFFNSDSRVSSWLQFIGRRTLDIYLLHYFLLPDLSRISSAVGDNRLLLIQFIAGGTLTAVVIVLCLLLSEVLRSSSILGHYLLGAKR